MVSPAMSPTYRSNRRLNTWHRMNGRLTSAEVCRHTGVPYRILDYACRTGALEAHNDGLGSGSLRYWSPDEVAVIDRLAEACAVIPIDFTRLAREAAADLRAGRPYTSNGPWGQLTINPPERTTP